jgi:hypothetical protein
LIGIARQTRGSPGETNGLDSIVEALITTLDHAEVLGLAEAHWDKNDSDLRIALVRHPEFPKKARFIVVECASTADQAILDRYVRGDDVPRAALQRVWTNTTQHSNVWQSPVNEDFLADVREVNAGIPPAGRIRVLARDPPPGSRFDRDGSVLSVIEKKCRICGEEETINDLVNNWPFQTTRQTLLQAITHKRRLLGTVSTTHRFLCRG